MPPSHPDAFKGSVEPTIWPTASVPFVLLHFCSACTLWCLMVCMKCLLSCLSSLVSGTNSKVLQRSSLGPLDIPAPPRTAHYEREGEGRKGASSAHGPKSKEKTWAFAWRVATIRRVRARATRAQEPWNRKGTTRWTENRPRTRPKACPRFRKRSKPW